MVAAAPTGTYSDESSTGRSMEFWPEFLATSGGREFVAGGVGGMAGVLAGHPLDTLRIRLQQPPAASPRVGLAPAHAPRRRDTPHPSAVRLLCGILHAEGPSALYRGMAAPLASVAFQVSHVCTTASPRFRPMPRRSGRTDHGFHFQDLGRRGFFRYVFLFCLSPLITYFYFFLAKVDRFQRYYKFLFAQKTSMRHTHSPPIEFSHRWTAL